MKKLKSQIIIKICLIHLFLFTGCAFQYDLFEESYYKNPERKLSYMRYSIQMGAFIDLENAVRLTERLKNYNLNAYYFVHKTGLYKVRMGDFSTKESAIYKAENIKLAGIIEAYYIVSPESYEVVKEKNYNEVQIRNSIVKIVKTYIGVPYRWGGESREEGFDCSGLSMVTYNLNGFKLPRTSGEQYRYGKFVSKKNLKKGDLVFFDIKRKGIVSHVGIYIGYNKFIHAPGRGKRIHISKLSNKFYKKKYFGARTYL